MDTQVYKLATTLIFIVVLLFRQAEGEERYKSITCTYDSDCTANAYCDTQSCQCKPGFVSFYTEQNTILCLKEASSPGDACEEDVQCTKPFGNHAECIIRKSGDGECDCMSNAHFKDGRCYETALIGQKCTVSNNCYLANGQPAYCVKSECTCLNGYHPNEGGTECIRTSQLDEPCGTDRECVTENSRCGDVCRCKVNYIQSRQKDKCLKAADKMGDPCVEDKQCTMFLSKATCDAYGYCSCQPGFHHIPPNSKCYSNIGLGGMCEDTDECVVPSAVCSEGICQCEQGLSPSEDNSKCSGDNGQKAVHHSLNVLLVTLVLPRIFQYLDSST